MKRVDYKWTLLALVSAAYFLAQGTRNVYGAVLPAIGADLRFSPAAQGAVATAFFATFGLMVPVAGFFADFFRRKWTIVIGMAVFSAAVLATGFAEGFLLLFVAYGIVNALGQSLMPPSNSSLIGQLHVETRSRAFAVYQTTFYIGIVVCACLGGTLTGLAPGGWRWAFKGLGALGLVWALVLAKFLRDTPQPVASHPSIRAAVSGFFGKPTALLLMLALGLYFYATNSFKTWAVTFMEKTMALDHAAASFNGTFWFYLGAISGVVLAGVVSDRLRARRPGVRLETNFVGLLLTIPFVLIAAFTGNLVILCGAVFAFGFATGVYDSNLYASLLDVVNPRYRAFSVGLFGCGGCLLGAPGPLVQGWMINRFGDRASMAALALFTLAAALVVLLARLVTFNRDRVSGEFHAEARSPQSLSENLCGSGAKGQQPLRPLRQNLCELCVETCNVGSSGVNAKRAKGETQRAQQPF